MTGPTIKTRTGTLSIDEALGIARFEYFPGADVKLEDAKENVAAMREISRGKLYPLVVRTAGMKAIDKDARNYFGSAEVAKVYKAIAFLGGTPISNMYTNFFIALFSSKESTPVKGFTKEADAIEWLNGFRD